MTYGGIAYGGIGSHESGVVTPPKVISMSGGQRRVDYEWILCHSPSNDDPFAPLEKIGNLSRAKSRQFDIFRNRGGSCSFSIRTDDPMAYEILDRVDLGDVRGTVRKCVRIRRNGRDLWSGPIWGITGSLASDQITINCVGWLETLVKKLLWNVLDMSNDGNGWPADHVAFAILDAANTQDPTHPLLIKPGSVTGPMMNRNRYYQYGQSVADAIQKLSDIEAGFDYEIDPVTREMNLYSWDSYPIREDVILGYNFGPNNLKDMGWREAGDQMCNKMVVISQGAPVGPIYDSDSQDDYGNFEEYVTLSGANQDVLMPYGVAELVIRSRPLITYTLVPKIVASGMPTGSPILFDNFDIGDKIWFSAHKNAFKVIKQAVRVFGASVALDDAGNETVGQLMTSPTGA